MQALSNLATTLDFDFPSRELYSTQLPNFALLSTLLVDLELVYEEDENIDAAFSCGLLDSITDHCDATRVETRVSTDKPQVELCS